MAKAYRSQERTLAGALWLGVFLGAAIATKITLIVFPGVVVLFLVLSTRPLGRSIRNAAVTGLAGLAVWMLVAWADQSFGFGRLSRQLYDLQGFVRSGGGGVGGSGLIETPMAAHGCAELKLLFCPSSVGPGVATGSCHM